MNGIYTNLFYLLAHLHAVSQSEKMSRDIIELPDYIFPTGCTVNISGPSGSGKTTFVMDILRYRQHLFSQQVEGVIYCYSEMQESFRSPPGGPVKFHYGLPSEEELERYISSFKGKFFLLIVDDMMSEVSNSSVFQDCSTKMCHHRNFTLISIAQNIFVQGKKSRTQSLNSHFYILTRTCRDLRQIITLGGQLFPGKGSKFLEIYKDAVDNPLRKGTTPALIVNCHPLTTNRNCQLLADIFGPIEGKPMVLYRI
jgi:hypothetical protein